MALRDRLRRLMKEAEGDGFLLRLSDGSVKVFDEMSIQKEMFLAKMDLFRETSIHSEVLDDVRRATPESRRAFEERYGSITPTSHVIGRDGWVEAYTLHEGGRVEKAFHVAGSQEAERLRDAARRGGQDARVPGKEQ